MEIKRDRYLNRIIDRKDNGMVKVITGIRRCGKSYLLFKLYKNYLLSIGIAENQIIEIAWDEYFNYGGMPALVNRKSDELKAEYLRSLFENVYIKDIKDRNDIRTDEELEILINILSSSIGSLTNPLKLSNSFNSMGKKGLSDKTIKHYIDYLMDGFLIEKAFRYDVKGKKYINTPSKYYFIDIGLRNARLNFRQQEESHIMENIIYNELRGRGYRVDVGVVECFEKNIEKKTERKSLEIDFIANKGNKKYYIQSALEISSIEKDKQEKKSLLNLNDSFKKLVIVKEDIKPRIDENGIITMGILEFLIDENCLEKL